MKSLERARVATSVVARYLRARALLAGSRPLPRVVDRLSGNPIRGGLTPQQLSRAVDKTLRLPGRPLRCLPRALVLYSLLDDDVRDLRLVVGLPDAPAGTQAHAWVELEGVDIGPPPGRGEHQVLVSYPPERSQRRE